MLEVPRLLEISGYFSKFKGFVGGEKLGKREQSPNDRNMLVDPP
jgi:hypothetical protein